MNIGNSRSTTPCSEARWRAAGRANRERPRERALARSRAYGRVRRVRRPHARAARRTRDDDRARRRRRRDREGRDRRLPGRGAGGTREREALGAGGSRSRIPYVHRSCRRLSPTSQKLKPTTAGIETLLRREVCEPSFWAAIYSWSEGAKSAHFDSGKLSSAKFGTCVVGETRLIQRADRAQETKTTHAQKRARPR